MNSVSSWAVNAQSKLHGQDPYKVIQINDAELVFFITENAVYTVADWTSGKTAFRMLYAAEGDLSIIGTTPAADCFTISLESPAAHYTIVVKWRTSLGTSFQYTTSIKPKLPLYFPFWTRDIIPLPETGAVQNTSRKVLARQVATHSGLLFVSRMVPKAGSF